jgi:signal transduction histidine kinase
MPFLTQNRILFPLRLLIESIVSQSRIKKKILKFLLIIGIIPLILLGSITIYLVNRTHRIDIAHLERTIISEKASEIEKFLNETIGLFQLQVAFKEYAEIKLDHQNFLLERILEENPYLEEVSFISLSGKETSRKVRSQETNLELRDRSSDGAFILAKEGKDYFGPVKFEKNLPIITIASPVINRENQIIAVLAGKVNLKLIQESVSTVNLGNSGYLYITDKEGNIIAHSKNLAIGESFKNLKIISDVLSGRERNGLRGEDIYKSFWGEKVIGAGNLLKNLQWAIIAEWPLNDAQKVVGIILFQFFVFLIITLMLIIVIASFMAFQLVRPVEILKRGAKEIGEGKLDTRILLQTGDEIEELGQSLNKMAENLKQLEKLHELKLKAKYLAEALLKERELSKIKDQFLTVASHQFLTPLSVIGWSLESLKTETDMPTVFKESFLAIDQSRKDLLNILDDLLTISEIGFNYRKTAGKIVSLESLVRSNIEKFKQAIAEKKLDVVIKVLSTNTDVEAEELILAKAINQLIDNAIIYSHDGGKITITIESDGVSVKFTIHDEGIGVPKDEQLFIFKEFFRAKNAVSKKNVGTGLGLFIVKIIINGHGGKVGFESEEDKGSVFYFTLPSVS